MSHTRIEEMFAESGLLLEEGDGLAEALAPLEQLAQDRPAPSAELAALFGQAEEVTSLAERRKRAVAGALVLALSAVGATGLSAAANTLPRPLQHRVSEFSQHYLPFDLPEPPPPGQPLGVEAPPGAPSTEPRPGDIGASRSAQQRPVVPGLPAPYGGDPQQSGQGSVYFAVPSAAPSSSAYAQPTPSAAPSGSTSPPSPPESPRPRPEHRPDQGTGRPPAGNDDKPRPADGQGGGSHGKPGPGGGQSQDPAPSRGDDAAPTPTVPDEPVPTVPQPDPKPDPLPDPLPDLGPILDLPGAVIDGSGG